MNWIAYDAWFSFYSPKYEGPMMVNAELDRPLAAWRPPSWKFCARLKRRDFLKQKLQKAKNSIKTSLLYITRGGARYANDYAPERLHIGYSFVQNYPKMIEKLTTSDRHSNRGQ